MLVSCEWLCVGNAKLKYELNFLYMYLSRSPSVHLPPFLSDTRTHHPPLFARLLLLTVASVTFLINAFM